MHTRAAVAVFDAEASNKIVTGKMTSDRSMSRPFPEANAARMCDVRATFRRRSGTWRMVSVPVAHTAAGQRRLLIQAGAA